MKDVSILILNWNTRDLLLDCIESIRSQTHGIDYEIVVVDNASSDGSVAAVAERYPDIRIVVNEKNEGFARGNNIGMDSCTGRYICLSNTDIVVLDDVLTKMVRYLDEHLRVGMLLPRCINGQHRLRRCCREFPSLRNQVCEALYLNRVFPDRRIFRGTALPEQCYENTRPVDTVPCCFTLVRPEAVDEVGKLDESFFFYGEDVDWCRRFHDHNWEVVYFADSSVVHFGGSSTADAPARFLIEKAKSTLIYWRKHHNLPSYYSIVAITGIGHVLRATAYYLLGFTAYRDRLNARSRSHDRFAVAKWIAANSHRLGSREEATGTR